MVTVGVFGLTLFVAVLLSGLAERSILSGAVLFLLVGILIGSLGLVQLDPSHTVVAWFAEIALFSVLFTDGMRVGLCDLRQAWHLPGRALLLGLPLTLVGTALLAKFVVGLSWAEALLVGAALSPTDPVFAAAIVGRSEIPKRLRHLLNVESGLNDGLSLPAVLIGIHLLMTGRVEMGGVLGEVAWGVVLGLTLPWLALVISRSRWFAPATTFEPLHAFAIGLLLLAVAQLTNGNEFLAAFAGGIMVATVAPQVRDHFHRFGVLISELAKLAALLVFGALIGPGIFADVSWGGYAFVVLALFLVRPAALALALWKSQLPWREWLTASWFGPKGFASVFFGLLILKSGCPGGLHLFHLIALTVAASIVLHSSTDVLFARWFHCEDQADHALRSRRNARMPGRD